MSFQVPMLRLPLQIVEVDGREFEGIAFLHVSSDDRSGPETLGRRLRLEQFLPFEIDGEPLLLNLAHVAYLEYEGKLPEVRSHDEVAGLRIPVRLELTNSEELSGDLLSSLPPDQGRALDLLNTLEQNFVLLEDGQVSRYVQRKAILRVR